MFHQDIQTPRSGLNKRGHTTLSTLLILAVRRPDVSELYMNLINDQASHESPFNLVVGGCDKCSDGHCLFFHRGRAVYSLLI